MIEAMRGAQAAEEKDLYTLVDEQVDDLIQKLVNGDQSRVTLTRWVNFMRMVHQYSSLLTSLPSTSSSFILELFFFLLLFFFRVEAFFPPASSLSDSSSLSFAELAIVPMNLR